MTSCFKCLQPAIPEKQMGYMYTSYFQTSTSLKRYNTLTSHFTSKTAVQQHHSIYVSTKVF